MATRLSSFPLHPPCPGACETEHPHGNSGSWSLDKKSWSRAAATTAEEQPSLGRKLALPISHLLIPEPALIGKCFRFLLQELLQREKQISNKLPLRYGCWDKGGSSWWCGVRGGGGSGGMLPGARLRWG